jgi:hypothetical protein
MGERPAHKKRPRLVAEARYRSRERSVRPTKAFAAIALQVEQELLRLETAGEPRQIAVRADDAMARRHDRDRVLAAGCADRTRGSRASDLLRDLGVGSRLTNGIFRSAFQTLVWNSIPTKSRGTENTFSVPSKHDFNCRSVSTRMSLLLSSR